MKKILGYGYKLGSESFAEAFSFYGDIKNLYKSKKEVLNEISRDKKHNRISKNAKPQIFKVEITVGGHTLKLTSSR